MSYKTPKGTFDILPDQPKVQDKWKETNRWHFLEETMRKNIEKMKYPSPYEMLKRLKQSGECKIYACTPTMEMFGVKREDLIPEVDKMVGAATFLNIAADADITLFI